MRKTTQKLFSIILIFLLLINSTCYWAKAITSTDFEKYIDSLSLPAEIQRETVNDSIFSYFIENEEATIIHILTNVVGPEKKSFVFPTELGGYSVKSIGYENGNMIHVFAYYNNGEDLSLIYPELDGDEPESDPGLRYINEIIIPEGYENICDNSFQTFYGSKFAVSFPKSLKTISGTPFEYLFTVNQFDFSSVKLPECIYLNLNKHSAPIAGTEWGNPVYLPSRDVVATEYLLSYKSKHRTELFVPSNISSTAVYDIFYYFEASAGDNGEIWQKSDIRCTFHCAPDSEFLSVFEKYGGHNTATIITDVTPAEYIEFPDETVKIHVGDVVDLEAKTYPTDAIWTACDYEVSDPSIVKIDEYSGRITALQEGTVTVTATHCERGFVDTCTVNVVPEPVPGVNEVKPATDTPYYEYGNRDYTLDVTGSPSKIQVVYKNGTTTTIDRRRATVTSNGETETWVVNMRVEAGAHSIRAKYGTKWDERLTPFTVTYDTPPTPKAYSFDLDYKNGLGTFEVVTDPQIIKVQFVLDNGCTLTYSQSNSYVAEDGLRHWIVNRQISDNTLYTLKTKLGYVWSTTDLTVTS